MRPMRFGRIRLAVTVSGVTPSAATLAAGKWQYRDFNASDNPPLAALGVPAHTICVAFRPPDDRGPADTWQEIGFENTALTVRMIGTALLTVAQGEAEPHWNPAVSQASRYLEAWKKRHPGEEGHKEPSGGDDTNLTKL